MEFIEQNRELLAWIFLWAWIALTIFLFSYRGSKSFKVYVVNLLLLGASLYFFFAR
jgi:hypothetical protein